MKTVLMTGFDVWAEHPYNSSWEAVRDARPALPDGWQVRAVQLPVSWRRSAAVLVPEITPDVRAVVSFGMSGSTLVQVERIAVNLTGPTLRDCDGELPPWEHVCEEGPPAYWTGLPYRRIVSALTAQGIATAENQFAGTYLCNFVFYTVMHSIATERPGITGGFVHVPAFDDRGGIPREALCRAVELIAQTVAEVSDD